MNWLRFPLPLIVATILLVFAAMYPDSYLLEGNLWPAFGYTAIYASSVFAIWPLTSKASKAAFRVAIVCTIGVPITAASIFVSSLIAPSIATPHNVQYRYIGNDSGTMIYQSK